MATTLSWLMTGLPQMEPVNSVANVKQAPIGAQARDIMYARVCLKTIANHIKTILFNFNIYFLESPSWDRNSSLTAKVWKNFSDNEIQNDLPSFCFLFKINFFS